MKWFKCKHSVCSECGVHFEPVTGYDEELSNLCFDHRRLAARRNMEISRAVNWTKANLEKVLKIIDDERLENVDKYRSDINRMEAAQQQNYDPNRNFRGQGIPGSIRAGEAVFCNPFPL